MAIKAVAAFAALVVSVVWAEAKTFGEMFPGRSYDNPKARELVEGLDYKDGAVAVGAGGVRLNVPGGFYFLSAEDAAGGCGETCSHRRSCEPDWASA